MCIIQTDPIVNFTEKINEKKAYQLSCLSNKEIKDIFWDKDELNKKDGSKWDWSSYITNIKKYCKIVTSKKGVIDQSYRYGKLKYDGRLYVNGFGLQSCQNKIRNFLCNDFYLELDIENCYPSLLLYISEKNDISCNPLKDYVDNRNNILEKYNLTKLDIIKVLNSDKNSKKKDNDWYNLFINEIEILKTELKKKINIPNVSNINNPVSASINKMIYDLEGEIVQKIITNIGKKNIGFPLFDAVYIKRDYKININEINKLFNEYKYIKFKIKETQDLDITLPDNLEEENMEYSKVKKEFEKDHFQTLSPPIFWKKIVLADNTTKYVQYNTKDFQLACKEYPILELDDTGKMKKKPIFDKWISDTTRRKYQSIDFMPYGNINNCPEHIFNTFEGFAINKKSVDNDMDMNIDNFTEFISNLVGEHDILKNGGNFKDCPKTNYFIKYIAQMFQFPEKRSDKIIVLKGWTGTGKDTLLKLFRSLMGYKYCDTTGDPTDLFKDFNDILDSKIAVFLNEMEGSDGVKIQEKLKELATREVNKVNSKHEKRVVQQNKLRLFVLSNNDSPVSIQIHDRRYIVFNCGFNLVIKTKNKEQSKYASEFWCKFNDDLKNINWLKKVYSQLMEIDLSDFCCDKSAPVTDEYKLLKQKSSCPIYNFIIELYEKKEFNDFYKIGDLYYINFKTFKNKYCDYLELHNIMPDYKIKEIWLKQKLSICKDTFRPSVRKVIQDGEMKIRREFSEFKFNEMVEFIKDYVLPDDDDNENEEEVLEKCSGCTIDDSDIDSD